MAGTTTSGPGAVRVAPGREHETVVLNADRAAHERITLVVTNTGDRPVQIGSHLHLPDANSALELDRVAAHGFRLDLPSGTSRRFEPGASAVVAAVTIRGARRVPGIQRGKADDGALGPVTGPSAPGSSDEEA
ncbi:urease subunit beta [Cellulomonas fulva]|uniref:urease subunit beta n=1 Tax=Cellulomonas fulva TaxID=2835530 RepID=UPI001F2D93E2|nr:urease subunit beta [Cellulomonas fulva]